MEPEVPFPTSQPNTLPGLQKRNKICHVATTEYSADRGCFFYFLPSWQYCGELSGLSTFHSTVWMWQTAVNYAFCSQSGDIRRVSWSNCRGPEQPKPRGRATAWQGRLKAPSSRHTCREGNSTSGCSDTMLVGRAHREAVTNQQF